MKSLAHEGIIWVTLKTRGSKKCGGDVKFVGMEIT